MTEPDGARSGTFWQLETIAKSAGSRISAARRQRVIMRALNILIPMHLAGQGETVRRRDESGYAMAALIMAITVMAIAMTVAMPVWKHASQREKEEELVFRGEQYVHAIGLFQRKYANAYPPTIDVLVQQKFLRKKYKDPITNDDFVPLTQASQQGAAQPGAQAGAQRG